jgi:O-antigen/teichoic acid export membrane protein
LFSQLLRLSRHSIIYGLGAAIGSVVGFFLIPLYTRYLTPSDYGVLQIFTATTSALGVFFILGISAALFRSYYLYDDAGKRREVASTAFLFLTASSTVLTLLLIGLSGSFSSLLFHSSEYTSYFRIIFLTLFCNTGIALGLAVFQARQQPTRYALVTVIQVVMSIALNIVFVMVLHRGVLGILEATLIVSAVIYLSLTAVLIKSAGFGFSGGELRRMLAYGLPLVPAGLSGWILTLADRYFLQFLSTPQELGLYSLGYRFGMVISALIVAPFAAAWVPFAFSIFKQENAKQVYSRAFTYFVLVAMLAALALSVLSSQVLSIMATPAFHAAYKVIPLIALSYVLYGCSAILGVGFALMAKTRYSALCVVVAAILNLGLNYLLIPGYGMMGAAWATLISYLVMAALFFIVSRRFYAVTYEWGRVAKICIAFGVVFGGSLFLTDTYSVVHSYIIVAVFKLLALLTFPIVLYLLRFYQPEEIQKTREIIRVAPGYLRHRLLRRPVSSGGSSDREE